MLYSVGPSFITMLISRLITPASRHVPIIILILLAVCLGSGLSCVTRPATVIRDYDLRGDQWKEFNDFRDTWVRNSFPRCLEQSKLHLTCDGCEKIYIVVRITINSDGKMVGYEKISEHVCGRPAPAKLERCFIEYLESIIFPRKLRSMIIETRLGNGLKC
jgi:hypothetical protein